MKYAFVDRNRFIWPIRVQCRVLGVSTTGYYQHKKRRERIGERRHLTDEALLVQIRAIHRETHGAYGWPRIWRELGKRGVRVGKQRVQRLMQEHGIHARGKRRFRPATTDSRHKLAVAENLLNRSFMPEAPNRSWSGDITYIATEEGWLYLAVVIELFSRKVVGWSMQPHMERSLVMDALRMAWQQRRPAKGELLFHSDRGSQYASEDFRGMLTEYGMTASMSRKGNCWDNAVSETLFGSLKVERLAGEHFQTVREAKDAVMEWLCWYNHSRMHSTLGYLSPAKCEQRWKQQQLRAA